MCRLKNFAMYTFAVVFGGDCFKTYLFVNSFVSPTFVRYVGGFIVVGVVDGGAYWCFVANEGCWLLDHG